MYKLLVFFLLSTIVYASEQVEIYADKVDSQNNIVNASGEVAVIYKDYYISAQKATYDKNTGNLELFENVRANQRNKYMMLGEYVRLNLKDKSKVFKPFYMLDEPSKIWVTATEASISRDDANITSGTLSSCDPLNPMWKMTFSSSEYDLNDRWFNLYNASLYFYDIPVFYTPWFGYSLNKERKTGLLLPRFGFSEDDGFYYEQPIFIVQDHSWDIELKPQTRTTRGDGIYSQFRFVDSKVSKGSFKFGFFKDQGDYFFENNLDSDRHYGFDIDYENKDFLHELFRLDIDGQSGLYVDLGYMNDVDYINLESSNTLPTAIPTQVLSRVNMFHNMEKDYVAAYVRNYQNLTLPDDDNTLQKLPTLHYHNYLKTLIDDHVFYNLDVQAHNIYRKVNTRAIQTDVNLPVTLYTSLFDEYLNVSMRSNVYAQNSYFQGDDTRLSVANQYENGTFARTSNELNLFTNLVKQYDEFSHSVNFGASYVFATKEDSTGYYDQHKDYCSIPANSTDPVCDLYNIEDVSEEILFTFAQYLYDDFGNETLYHRINQVVEQNKDLGELENELNYIPIKSLTLYNNMFFNHDKSKFSKVYNKISYETQGFDFAVSHLYKDTFLNNTTQEYVSYLTTQAQYTYKKKYVYSLIYDYDIELQIKKRAEVGFLYKKRCWDFGIRYSQINRPELGKNGIISNQDERYVYFTVALKPFIKTSDNGFLSYNIKSTNNE